MQIIKLSNGLALVSYPIECAQSVEMGMYIKAGSRYETKENNGITHMLEHMHFRQLGEILQEDIYRETLLYICHKKYRQMCLQLSCHLPLSVL